MDADLNNFFKLFDLFLKILRTVQHFFLTFPLYTLALQSAPSSSIPGDFTKRIIPLSRKHSHWSPKPWYNSNK